MYDIIIIGSSPICMLCAIKYSEAGLKIALIERSENIGGAWSILLDPNVGLVETGCHLIEYYHRVYDLLERISGVAFLPFTLQPTKVYRNGKILSYSSLRWYIQQFNADISSLFKLVAKCIFVCLQHQVTPSQLNSTDYSKLGATSYKLRRKISRIIFLLRYRWLRILNNRKLKGPLGGWKVFIESLIKRLENIDIIKEEVIYCREQQDYSWIIFTKSGLQLGSSRLVLTESTECILYDFTSNVSALQQSISVEKSSYFHVLISAKYTDLMNAIPYIHFIDHPEIKRATPSHHFCFNATFPNKSSDVPQKIAILVQLRKHPKLIEELECKVAQALILANVLGNDAKILVHDFYEETRVVSGMFRPGTVRNLCVLESIGDLGISLLRNNFQFT